MKTKLGVGSALCLLMLVLSSTWLELPVLASLRGEGRQGRGQDLLGVSILPAPTPLVGPEPEGWTAAQTSVSVLSQEDRSGLCGVPLAVIEWEEEQASQQPPMLSASYTYPPALDWRNYGGMNWTTPIRHQGSCASCPAFATVAAIESRLEIAEGDPGLNPNLSEAHLFYCGCGACCGSGAGPISLMEFARDTGIADEGCFPYTALNQACSPCQGWQNRVTKISDWAGVTGVENMKQTLADAGPFEASMIVYSDFYDYSGGVYRHTYGSLEGGHAVTIVGYNDYGGYWIVKNSWGTGWGENGWFRIAYGQCSIDNYAYVPIVAEPSYQVSASASPQEGGVIAAEPPDCAVDTCDPGTVVELTASSNAGYAFNGWSGDASGSENPISMVVDGNKEVTAHFTLRCDECTPQAFLPIVIR